MTDCESMCVLVVGESVIRAVYCSWFTVNDLLEVDWDRVCEYASERIVVGLVAGGIDRVNVGNL